MNWVDTSLAAFTIWIGAGIGSAQAGSLSTDVTVNLSSVLGLVCFDQVDVNLSADTVISTLGRNNGRPMPTLNRNARVRNDRLIAGRGKRFWNRGRFKFRQQANLDLRNVCAYHAMGGIGGARVTIDALERRLEAAGGSHIQVRRVRTRDNINAGPWRRRYNIPPADLTPGTVRGIDVRLRLDMRNAKEPGLYSSATDGTFRITVTPNP